MSINRRELFPCSAKDEGKDPRRGGAALKSVSESQRESTGEIIA